jgi:hypothetical protein
MPMKKESGWKESGVTIQNPGFEPMEYDSLFEAFSFS